MSDTSLPAPPPSPENPSIQEHKSEGSITIIVVPTVEESVSVIEEPTVEETKVEEPTVEQLKVEEPKVEEPKVEEPKVEEPKVEETKVEETKVEDPKEENPITTSSSATYNFFMRCLCKKPAEC